MIKTVAFQTAAAVLCAVIIVATLGSNAALAARPYAGPDATSHEQIATHGARPVIG